MPPRKRFLKRQSVRCLKNKSTHTPEATAIVQGERSFTYLELNEQANRLAHYLIARGIGPESLVGIALERSPEMVVAILAAWKSGAAYLPLDPEYPPARLEHMLADARPRVVLTVQKATRTVTADVRHRVHLP